jgi:hypothetical protein
MKFSSFIYCQLILISVLLVTTCGEKSKNSIDYHNRGKSTPQRKKAESLSIAKPKSSRRKEETDGSSSASKKHRKRSQSKKGAIIPVKREPLSNKAFRGFSMLTDTLKKSAETAIVTAERVNRDIKRHLSSDFETFLLKITKPDDSRIEETDIDRFIATTESFVRNMDLNSESNPYRVTLRKLWSKISERDARTALKGLYLLHTLLKFSEPEDAMIYKNLITKMSREYCEKSKSKYFDLSKARIKALVKQKRNDSNEIEGFVTRYSSYVLRRARAFTASFEEMKLIGYGMRTEDICAQLVKAYKVIDSALSCQTTAEEESSEVVVACVELIARDLRDLFNLYSQKLRWVLAEEEIGDVFAGWNAVEVHSILKHFKDFYNKKYEDVQTLLIEASEMLELYKISLPVSLEGPATFTNEDLGDDACAQPASPSPTDPTTSAQATDTTTPHTRSRRQTHPTSSTTSADTVNSAATTATTDATTATTSTATTGSESPGTVSGARSRSFKKKGASISSALPLHSAEKSDHKGGEGGMRKEGEKERKGKGRTATATVTVQPPVMFDMNQYAFASSSISSLSSSMTKREEEDEDSVSSSDEEDEDDVDVDDYNDYDNDYDEDHNEGDDDEDEF